MVVLETDRLVLRRLTVDDSSFILRLLNEPFFLQHVGDRGVRNLADAKQYILSGPIAGYDRHGFGLLLVELKQDGRPIGVCGLRRRDELDDAELTFAFVRESWFMGYGFESTSAVLAHARDTLHLRRVVAVTSPDNVASINLLVKLGFYFDRMVQMPGDRREVKRFARRVTGSDM